MLLKTALNIRDEAGAGSNEVIEVETEKSKSWSRAFVRLIGHSFFSNSRSLFLIVASVSTRTSGPSVRVPRARPPSQTSRFVF